MTPDSEIQFPGTRKKANDRHSRLPPPSRAWDFYPRRFTVSKCVTRFPGREFMRLGLVSHLQHFSLREAQRHPAQHRDLIVRVAGHSDYFCGLSKELQEEIIERTEHEGF